MAGVTSGVPHGSVLGSCLFLLYINDLSNSLTSTVRLFAGDTIAYLTVSSQEVAEVLQHDLDKLAEWEKTWQVEFHLGKCQVLRVTRNRDHIVGASYCLHGHELETVKSAKYSGVTMQPVLRWISHISNLTKKANATQGFLLKVPSPKLKEKALQLA